MSALQPFLDASGRLTAFPAKFSKKLVALAYLVEKLVPGQLYTEAELNRLLEQWHSFHDPATLRRELINNHFLGRAPDGSAYWLEENQPDPAALLRRFG